MSEKNRTSNVLIAGFGGQGVLFTGKFLAYAGLIEGRELSWLPSYGPEMRGGTANCSLILSDEPVGSPIVDHPDILLVMNLPSLDKFEDAVVPGGKIFVDSSLVGRKVRRTDVESYYIPATKLSFDRHYESLANMILLGKVIGETGLVSLDTLPAAMDKAVSARHRDLAEKNLEAIVLPEDDKLIVSVHAYTPYDFALNTEGTSVWDVDKDKYDIDYLMETINALFISKGIPVIIGEFGAMNKENEEERMEWVTYYLTKAREIGVPCVWWDNNAFVGNGENFGLLDRRKLEYPYPKLLEAMMKVVYPEE